MTQPSDSLATVGEFVMFASADGKAKTNIRMLIKHMFVDGSLIENSVVRLNRTTEHQQFSSY